MLALLAAALTYGGLGAYGLLRESGYEEPDWVYFHQVSIFHYRGCVQDPDLPIENVVIEFPLPRTPTGVRPLEVSGTWSLYWVDEENNFHLQVERVLYAPFGWILREHGYREPRKGPVKILDVFWNTNGDYDLYYIDKLYPGEAFVMFTQTKFSKKDLDLVTLRGSHSKRPENCVMGFQAFSGVGTLETTRPELTYNITVETYLRQEGQENFIEAWYRVYDNSEPVVAVIMYPLKKLGVYGTENALVSSGGLF